MNLQEWQEQQAERKAAIDDVLPSGLEIQRRKHLSLEAMVFKGTLPVGVFATLVEGEGEQIELDISDVLANAKDYAELIDAVFKAAMVNPAIGKATDLDAEPPVLALAEFDELPGDKLYVLSAVMEEVEELRPFRGESGEQDETGTSSPNGRGVQPETVTDVGDSG